MATDLSKNTPPLCTTGRPEHDFVLTDRKKPWLHRHLDEQLIWTCSRCGHVWEQNWWINRGEPPVYSSKDPRLPEVAHG